MTFPEAPQGWYWATSIEYDLDAAGDRMIVRLWPIEFTAPDAHLTYAFAYFCEYPEMSKAELEESLAFAALERWGSGGSVIPRLPAAPHGYRWELKMDLECEWPWVDLNMIPNALGRALGYEACYSGWAACDDTREQAYERACQRAAFHIELHESRQRIRQRRARARGRR